MFQKMGNSIVRRSLISRTSIDINSYGCCFSKPGLSGDFQAIAKGGDLRWGPVGQEFSNLSTCGIQAPRSRCEESCHGRFFSFFSLWREAEESRLCVLTTAQPRKRVFQKKKKKKKKEERKDRPLKSSNHST